MSVFKGGGNKSSINRNTGKSLIGRGINIPFSELTSNEVKELSEGISNGSLGNNTSGGLTEDQEIEDSQVVGSTIDDTIIGGTTASTANFTTVNITNNTPASSSSTGSLIVAGGIGVSERSYFGEQLHAEEFHGCGRNITSILGENIIGNVSAEPNYLIIKVGQHCVVPPNIAPNINAVGIGSGHWLFGYNSLIAGGKNSNNYSRLSAIVAGNSQTIYNNGNLSVILGGDNNKIYGSNSSILSSINSNITGLSSLVLGGNNNLVSGDNSTALGSNISITHDGSTLISDNQSSTYSSDANNQFKVRASGGSTFNSILSVSGSTTLNSSLSVIGTTTLTDEVSINSVSESTSPSDGALTVAGGVGIGKDLRLGDDLSLNSNNAVIFLGESSDVSLTHIPSNGLRLNSSNKLQFRDADIHVSSDTDGYLNLQADTGININVNGNDEILVTATESTFSGNIVIPDGLLIGTTSDSDALSISNQGEITLSSTVESSNTTSGALIVSGGVGINKDLYIGDNLYLNSDDSLLNFGNDNDVNLLHIPDTGIRLNDNMKFQFRDADVHVSSDTDGFLNLQADTGVSININNTDQLKITSSESTFTGNIVLPDNLFIGSASDQNAISISDTGVLSLSSIIESTDINSGALIVSGGVGINKDLYVGGNLNLNSDNCVVNFGSDNEVNLTHVPDTGLKLNDNMKLQFRDSDIHINSNSDGNLNIQADTGINININGTNELTITSSTSNFSGNIVIPNNSLIGSSSKQNALQISNQGDLTLNSTTESTNTSSGALIVSGGVGIGKDLFVGGNLIIPDSGKIGSVSDENAINILSTGEVSFTSTVESSNITTGTIIVAGGVGISKKLNVGELSTFEKGINCLNTINGSKNLKVGINSNCNIINSSILGASNSNITTGNNSVIISGEDHNLNSNNSIILNGKQNNNQADYSICSGYGSKTQKLGQISHAMGYFNNIGDSQLSNFILRRTITHISGTTYKIGINNLEPTVSNDASITIDNNSMFSYNINLTGISTTNNKFWNFILKGVVYCNSSGNYTHIKGTKEIIVKNKTSDDANIDVDSTYGIYLIIKINSNYTIQWMSSLNAIENKL